MILNSYAKVNLYLEVLNKRPDHYHHIRTIFERIDLCDRLILKIREDKKITLSCEGEDIPQDFRQNLAYQSARLLQEKLHLNQGVDIRLIKRIPVGSGLGGGSSNAAFVLLGLNQLWKLGLQRERLVELARPLGCDVPFFIYNCSFAQGQGRGDEIKPLKTLEGLRFWHLVVVPKIKVATPFVYKKWDEYSALTPPLRARAALTPSLTRPKYGVKILKLGLEKKDFSLIGRALFNSLERVTLRLYPRIRAVKEKFLKLGIQSVLMSGSGPAFFGMVSTKKEAVKLYQQMKKNKYWRVFLVRTL